METTTPTPCPVANPYLDRAAVAALLAVSVRQLDRIAADPEANFPPARRFGQRRRWLESGVRRWAERQ